MSLFLPLDVFCERRLCRLRVCFAISVPMLTVCECICVCSCTLLMKSDFLRKKRYILSVHLYFFYATDLRFRFRLASGQRINAAGSRYSQVQQVRLCCVYVCVILRALDSSTALSSSVQLNKLQLLSLCSGGTPQQPAHLQVITMLSPTSPTSSINTHGANTAHPWEEEEGGGGRRIAGLNKMFCLSISAQDQIGSFSVGFAGILSDCRILRCFYLHLHMLCNLAEPVEYVNQLGAKQQMKLIQLTLGNNRQRL